jgi:predicted acylesterase/phospholipase RssA
METVDPRQFVDFADFSRLAKCKYFVFSGGATRGISICGTFHKVAELYQTRTRRSLVRQLRGAGGSSIGSIIALAVVCNVSLDTLELTIKDESMWDTAFFVREFDLARFANRGGMYDHKHLFGRIDRAFQLLGLPLDIDFYRLYKRTGKLFVCNACCLDDNSILYMSHLNTPYLRVRDALCMAMCLPVIFDPFLYNGKEYRDGGTLANYIMNQFPESETMGIAMDNRTENYDPLAHKQENGIEVTLKVINSLCAKLDQKNLDDLTEEQKASTIFVYTPGFKQMKVVVSREEINTLWYYGQLSALWYFTKYYYLEWLLEQYILQRIHKQHREETNEEFMRSLTDPKDTISTDSATTDRDLIDFESEPIQQQDGKQQTK